jgi:predicted permease
MESMGEVLRRLRGLLRGGRQRAELEEEIRYHIERQAERNVRAGMSPGDARRAAVARFGGVEQAKEAAMDERRPVALDDVVRDLRYGLRTLLRARGFAAISVLTLGIGIGAATTIYTVVNRVLLKPLPYPESERVARLFQVDETGNRFSVSEPNYDDWQAQTRSFAHMAKYQVWGARSVTGAKEPVRAVVTPVSREFFAVLRVRPARGRGFAPEEQRQGAAPVALVSDAFWRRWLDAAPDVSGRTLSFDGRTVTVVGVMPAGFDYPGKSDIWFPLELLPRSESRTAHNFSVVGRLAEGRTMEQANAELSAVSRALKGRHGDETWMFDAAVVSLHDQLTANVRPALYVLMGAAGFLLLIACANVSNLLLARAATRRRELAVRLALGAGRRGVARQLLAESLVLCLAGGALGAWIAFAGVRALLALNPVNLPRLDEIRLDGGALAFAAAVSITIAFLLGLVATLRAGERDLRAALTEGQRTMAGGRASQRVRHGLVIAQVALTMVLLTGAGLLARSFLRLLEVETGYDLERGLLLELRMPRPQDAAEDARQWAFQQELMTRLRALPGVEAVGGISDSPLGWLGNYANGQFLEMTRPDEIQTYEEAKRLPDVKERAGFAGFRVASGSYFRAAGIPVLRGRAFEDGDAAGAPHVAVISESLAKQKWPDQDPIGKFIQFGNMDGYIEGLRIIGIVGDVREASPEAVPGPLVYAEYRQRPAVASQFAVIMRGTEDAGVATAAQRLVRELDPQLPVRILTVDEARGTVLASRTFNLVLLAVFAVVALVLATLGIYGVISYLVAQRTREIGIRMALGAGRTTVLRDIVGQGAGLAGIGIACGFAGAVGLSRVVEGMVFGVSARDPVALAGVAAVLTLAALTASWVPARRAARVAPAITLRTD